MSLIKKGYEIYREAVDPFTADLIYDYLQLKQKVQQTLIDDGEIRTNDELFGHYEDLLVPGTWNIYGDPLNDIFLHKFIPLFSQVSKRETIPNYSYARLYKKGDVLTKHLDRPSCGLSGTLCLGGDPWSIFVKDFETNEVEINLKPGDVLVYDGVKCLHWREKFKGKKCGQLFLHYGYADNPEDMKNIFDGRKHLGLPRCIKK